MPRKHSSANHVQLSPFGLPTVPMVVVVVVARVVCDHHSSNSSNNGHRPSSSRGLSTSNHVAVSVKATCGRIANRLAHKMVHSLQSLRVPLPNPQKISMLSWTARKGPLATSNPS